MIEFFRRDDDMPVGAILIAADDGGAVDRAVDGAVFRIVEALAAVGVQQMARGHVAAAYGRIGLKWNARPG